MSQMKDEVIKLNVGGKVFKASRNILCRYRKSLLCELVSDMLRDTNDQSNKEKELFIDRNGNRFEYILDFLRDGILICENNMNLLTKILVEAAYFRLDPLVRIVKQKINSVMFDVDRSINRKMIELIFKQIDEHGNCWNKKIGALCNDTLMAFCSDLLNNEFIDKQDNTIIPQKDVQTLGLLNVSENISEFRKLKFSKLKKKKVHHRSNLVHYETNSSKNKEDKTNSVNESSIENSSNQKETNMKETENKESSDLEKAYKTGSTDVEDIYHVKINQCDQLENEYYDLNRTPKRDSMNLFLTAPSESESLNKNSALKSSRVRHDNNRSNSMYQRGSYVQNNHSNVVVSGDIRGRAINNLPEEICEENKRNVYFTNTTGHMNENYINQERMVTNGSMIPRGNNVTGPFHYVDQQNNKTDSIITYVDTDDIEETSPFHTTSNVNLGEPVFSTTADF